MVIAKLKTINNWAGLLALLLTLIIAVSSYSNIKATESTTLLETDRLLVSKNDKNSEEIEKNNEKIIGLEKNAVKLSFCCDSLNQISDTQEEIHDIQSRQKNIQITVNNSQSSIENNEDTNLQQEFRIVSLEEQIKNPTAILEKLYSLDKQNLEKINTITIETVKLANTDEGIQKELLNLGKWSENINLKITNLMKMVEGQNKKIHEISTKM